MSDTPDTDAQSPWRYSITTPNGVTTHYVPADFARKLERERNNLQDQRDFAMGEIERLRKERDEARALQSRPRFEAELRELINKNSIENFTDMPDFLLAKMICRFIEAVGPSIKDTLDWHGCNSVCHPASAPNKEAAQ